VAVGICTGGGTLHSHACKMELGGAGFTRWATLLIPINYSDQWDLLGVQNPACVVSSSSSEIPARRAS
jgi:hypothetical protein